VIAAHDAEQSPGVGKRSFFDVFDPRSIDADRDFVFRFAGDRAGVTADALAVIDDKTKVHKILLADKKNYTQRIVESGTAICLVETGSSTKIKINLAKGVFDSVNCLTQFKEPKLFGETARGNQILGLSVRLTRKILRFQPGS
jgi:hypothetical protein